MASDVTILLLMLWLLAFSIVVGLLFIYALSRLNAARFAAHAQYPKTNRILTPAVPSP